MMSLKRVAPLFETASTVNVILILFSQRHVRRRLTAAPWLSPTIMLKAAYSI
jgi:hypothetical protein